MRRKLLLTTLVADSLATSTLAAFSQVAPPSSPGGSATGSPGVSPATPPPAAAPTSPGTTGSNTGINQPGVPDTSTPGRIETGASPSGLPGDSPSNPGYPDKVGK